MGHIPKEGEAWEMHEQIAGRQYLRKGVDQPRAQSQVLRRLHEVETVEQGSHRQVLSKILGQYGLDDRETFIFMARGGFVYGYPMSYREIGEACREGFGYAVTRQRVFSVIRAILDRMSEDDKLALKRAAPAIFMGQVSRLMPDDKLKRDQSLAIGRMRRGAKSLKIALNYGDVLKHFGVDVPPKRAKTASLMGPEASMIALHEDFRMRAACGWRRCVKCARALRESQYYVGKGGVVPWCKDCNRKMARDRYHARKMVE